MRKLMIVAIFSFMNCAYAADEITVINEMPQPVYAALYYVKTNILGMSNGPANRVVNLRFIGQYQRLRFIRPRSQSRMRRELIFSLSPKELTPIIEAKKYQEVSKISIESGFQKIYHIAFCNEQLCGYGEISWRFIKPVKDFFKKIYFGIIQKFKRKLLKHPYEITPAFVRTGKDISSQENNAVAKRWQRAQPALETFVGESIPKNVMPRIAICTSGGCTRAALCSYGLISGLDHLGLLDAVLYAGAISGSSWFFAHFLASGIKLNEYEEYLIKSCTDLHMLNAAVVSQVLWKKLLFGQDVGLIDLYGIFLANQWFRNINNDIDRQNVFLSDLDARVGNGEWIFPLFTAIETTFDYNWFTFTPYEIGSESAGIYIPAWSFGRKFENGKSIDFAPEPSLGYLMGVWGSALSGTIGDILQRLNFAVGLPGALAPMVREIIYSTKIDKATLAPASVFNFAKGMKGVYKNREKMTFIDAGYDCFIPIVPLLNKERAIDIIIVLDVTMGVHSGITSPLHDAQEYARAHRLSFPEIDYRGLTERFISVFDNKNDPECPTIIYLIPVKNDKYDSTFDPALLFDTTYATTKFSFTRPQIEKLIGLVRQSVIDNKEIIIKAIKDKIEMKKNAALAV